MTDEIIDTKPENIAYLKYSIKFVIRFLAFIGIITSLSTIPINIPKAVVINPTRIVTIVMIEFTNDIFTGSFIISETNINLQYNIIYKKKNKPMNLNLPLILDIILSTP
jgi:hypothetical protein